MEAVNYNIKLNECIIPMYDDVLEDILNHGHTHYVFPGGRGSTKSSFVGGIAIPLLIMTHSGTHAVCFRKVGNTVQKSIFAQIIWGIYKLGVESLFHIPKTFATPIVYKPTGQQIICMGLDDPMKVKSIKLPFGYIGITWFEELDQYAGENQLRTVTQSTMRGGPMFWDFRTFNPPISKNNWANEYADECEFSRKHDTLVVRNSYLDVPVEWLGQQFIDEAEELKRLNPRAYTHEYLGVAIGTGGDVFPNVEEFDSSKPIEIFNADGSVAQRIDAINMFTNIYCGLDWGFALDPLHFVRCHFDNRKYDLYIFREFRQVKLRNRDAYEILYNEKKLINNNELLIADSAEPKSIMDFKAYGAYIRGAEKGPDSVRYGIKWLQGLNHIYIDRKMCPGAYDEFTQYEFEQDKDGNFISEYPDANNHSIDAVRYGTEKFWIRKGN